MQTEDPVWGMPQLRRLKKFVPLPIATNTVVVNFEQLASNIQSGAVDVILLDTTFWGGIRPCIYVRLLFRRDQRGWRRHSKDHADVAPRVLRPVHCAPTADHPLRDEPDAIG